jgi:hypothetical protein
MSADNCIAIALFPDGFRVAHAQAIENLDYFPKETLERKQVLKDYFGDSKVYPTKEEVLKRADEIYQEMEKEDFFILEYGICFVGEYEEFQSIL